jgi:hypothetical protein
MRLLWRRTKSNFFTLLRCNMMGVVVPDSTSPLQLRNDSCR